MQLKVQYLAGCQLIFKELNYSGREHRCYLPS
jgi:hypothetical protein